MAWFAASVIGPVLGVESGSFLYHAYPAQGLMAHQFWSGYWMGSPVHDAWPAIVVSAVTVGLLPTLLAVAPRAGILAFLAEGRRDKLWLGLGWLVIAALYILWQMVLTVLLAPLQPAHPPFGPLPARAAYLPAQAVFNLSFGLFAGGLQAALLRRYINRPLAWIAVVVVSELAVTASNYLLLGFQVPLATAGGASEWLYFFPAPWVIWSVGLAFLWRFPKARETPIPEPSRSSAPKLA